jgi:hypothetical protein
LAIKFEQSEESKHPSTAIYTATRAVLLLAILAVLIFMRKRLLEGRCDDNDLENNITNTNVTNNMGLLGTVKVCPERIKGL